MINVEAFYKIIFITKLFSKITLAQYFRQPVLTCIAVSVRDPENFPDTNQPPSRESTFYLLYQIERKTRLDRKRTKLG